MSLAVSATPAAVRPFGIPVYAAGMAGPRFSHPAGGEDGEAPAEPGRAAEPQSGTGRHKILIVEDEVLIALNIAAELTGSGYEVVAIADTAEAAMQAASRHRPDLVLMDITLRGARDGIAAAEQLQRRFAVPILYVTAHADIPTRARAAATGPIGYLVKPFSGRQLLAAVAGAFASP